jgi:hypothetical protein
MTVTHVSGLFSNAPPGCNHADTGSPCAARRLRVSGDGCLLTSGGLIVVTALSYATGVALPAKAGITSSANRRSERSACA